MLNSTAPQFNSSCQSGRKIETYKEIAKAALRVLRCDLFYLEFISRAFFQMKATYCEILILHPICSLLFPFQFFRYPPCSCTVPKLFIYLNLFQFSQQIASTSVQSEAEFYWITLSSGVLLKTSCWLYLSKAQYLYVHT